MYRLIVQPFRIGARQEKEKNAKKRKKNLETRKNWLYYITERFGFCTESMLFIILRLVAFLREKFATNELYDKIYCSGPQTGLIITAVRSVEASQCHFDMRTDAAPVDKPTVRTKCNPLFLAACSAAVSCPNSAPFWPYFQFLLEENTWRSALGLSPRFCPWSKGILAFAPTIELLMMLPNVHLPFLSLLLGCEPHFIKENKTMMAHHCLPLWHVLLFLCFPIGSSVILFICARQSALIMGA